MKHKLLIILLFLSSVAFGQYSPSFDRFQFEMSDVFRKWDSTMSTTERSFMSLQGEPDTSGKIHFQPPPSNGEHNIFLSIDGANKLITSFIYKYHNFINVPQMTATETFDTVIVLKNIPYIEKGDTLLFDMDSSLFASCIISITGYFKFDYFFGNDNDYTSFDTIKKLTGASRFRGFFIKLNSAVSGFIPKQYSTTISPDFTKRNYEQDSIALTYRNDLSDTVTITKVRYYDALSNHVEVAYSDDSPLTKPQIILPLEKKHQLFIKFVSNEGPYTSYSSSRSATLIIDKLIRGVLYHDTAGLGLTLKGFNFETQITTDKPYNLIDIECKPGDTVLTKIHILYTAFINNIVFDPIPDSTGFKLVNVVHNPNDKEVEIRFIANKEGEYQYWHPIQYVVKNFDGTLQQYTSEQFIKLHSYVAASNAVTSDMHPNEWSVYPNPSSSLINISSVSQERQPYTISIFDELGREVRRVHEGFLEAGEHEFSAELPTGMYYVRMQAGDEVLTRKVTVIR